jgi:hypothetical protein
MTEGTNVTTKLSVSKQSERTLVGAGAQAGHQ